MNIIVEKPNPLGPYERTYPDIHPGFMLATTTTAERHALAEKLGNLVSLVASIGGLEGPIAENLHACIENHIIPPKLVQSFTQIFGPAKRSEGKFPRPSAEANPYPFRFATSTGMIGNLSPTGCVQPHFQLVYFGKGRQYLDYAREHACKLFAQQIELVWTDGAKSDCQIPQILSDREHLIFGEMPHNDNKFVPTVIRLADDYPTRTH